MIKVLFICHGNICRSPMAEFVMKEMVKRCGVENEYSIASAATSSEEIGNALYPPVRSLLARHGIDCTGKTARRLTARDCEEYDLLICMDDENVRAVRRLCTPEQAAKVHRLLDYTSRGRCVADPWYTRNFEATWCDVVRGCAALLKQLSGVDAPIL